MTHGEKLLALLQAGSAANPQELAREFAKVSGLIGQLQQQKVVEELIGLDRLPPWLAKKPARKPPKPKNRAKKRRRPGGKK